MNGAPLSDVDPGTEDIPADIGEGATPAPGAVPTPSGPPAPTNLESDKQAVDQLLSAAAPSADREMVDSFVHDAAPHMAREWIKRYEAGEPNHPDDLAEFYSKIAQNGVTPWASLGHGIKYIFSDPKKTSGDLSKMIEGAAGGIVSANQELAKPDQQFIDDSIRGHPIDALWNYGINKYKEMETLSQGAARGVAGLAPALGGATAEVAQLASQPFMGEEDQQNLDAKLNAGVYQAERLKNLAFNRAAEIAKIDPNNSLYQAAEQTAPLLIPLGGAGKLDEGLGKLADTFYEAGTKTAGKTAAVAGKAGKVAAPAAAGAALYKAGYHFIGPEVALAGYGAQLAGRHGVGFGRWIANVINAPFDPVIQWGQRVATLPEGETFLGATRTALEDRASQLQAQLSDLQSTNPEGIANALKKTSKGTPLYETTDLQGDALRYRQTADQIADLQKKSDGLKPLEDANRAISAAARTGIKYGLESGAGSAIGAGFGASTEAPGDYEQAKRGAEAGALLAGAGGALRVPLTYRGKLREFYAQDLLDLAQDDPNFQANQPHLENTHPEARDLINKFGGLARANGRSVQILPADEYAKEGAETNGYYDKATATAKINADAIPKGQGTVPHEVTHALAEAAGWLDESHPVAKALDGLFSDDLLKENLNASRAYYQTLLNRDDPNAPPITDEQLRGEIVADLATDILKGTPPEALVGGRSLVQKAGAAISKWLPSSPTKTAAFGFPVTPELRGAVSDALFEAGKMAEFRPKPATGEPTAAPELDQTTNDIRDQAIGALRSKTLGQYKAKDAAQWVNDAIQSIQDEGGPVTLPEVLKRSFPRPPEIKAAEPGGKQFQPSTQQEDSLIKQARVINNKLQGLVNQPDNPAATRLSQQKLAIFRQIHQLRDQQPVRETAIIGGGPAGLGAAINLGYEGADVVVYEKAAQTGGQPRYSSRIENVGASEREGITGPELSNKQHMKALLNGAEIKAGTGMKSINYDPDTSLYTVEGTDGVKKQYQHVVMATGIKFRPLDVPGSELAVNGNGLLMSQQAKGGTAVVVGGGNAASQAALGAIEGGGVKNVVIFSRSPLEKAMSRTQMEQLMVDPRVKVEQDQIAKIEGQTGDLTITTQSGKTIKAQSVGSFIGGKPDIKGLPTGVRTDAKGFIEANPVTLETSLPNLYVAGDARAGDLATTGRLPRIEQAKAEGQRTAALIVNRLAQSEEKALISGEKPPWQTSQEEIQPTDRPRGGGGGTTYPTRTRELSTKPQEPTPTTPTAKSGPQPAEPKAFQPRVKWRPPESDQAPWKSRDGRFEIYPYFRGEYDAPEGVILKDNETRVHQGLGSIEQGQKLAQKWAVQAPEPRESGKAFRANQPRLESNKVDSPAIQVGEGKDRMLFRGRNWDEARTAARMFGLPNEQVDKATEGFITRKGQFMDSDQAPEHMTEIGQIKPEDEQYPFTTEDFYKKKLFQPSQDSEAVKEPAIRMPDGKVYTGPFHSSIEAENQLPEGQGDYGYVSNSGDFLSPQEALDRALSKDQISQEAYSKESGLGAGDQRAIGLESDAFKKARQFQPRVVSAEGRLPEGQQSHDEIPNVFYSTVENTIRDKIPNAASADQILKTLQNTPGVKREELSDLGLTDWLNSKKGPISKQDLLIYVESQQPVITEHGIASTKFEKGMEPESDRTGYYITDGRGKPVAGPFPDESEAQDALMEGYIDPLEREYLDEYAPRLKEIEQWHLRDDKGELIDDEGPFETEEDAKDRAGELFRRYGDEYKDVTPSEGEKAWVIKDEDNKVIDGPFYTEREAERAHEHAMENAYEAASESAFQNVEHNVTSHTEIDPDDLANYTGGEDRSRPGTKWQRYALKGGQNYTEAKFSVTPKPPETAKVFRVVGSDYPVFETKQEADAALKTMVDSTTSVAANGPARGEKILGINGRGKSPWAVEDYKVGDLLGGKSFEDVLGKDLTLKLKRAGGYDLTGPDARQVAQKLSEAGILRIEETSESGQTGYHSHWDESNVLAHSRYHDFETTDGHQLRLIDEFQSDPHQQARDARKTEIDRQIAQGMSPNEAQKAVPKDFGYKPRVTYNLDTNLIVDGGNFPTRAAAELALEEAKKKPLLNSAPGPWTAEEVPASSTPAELNLALGNVSKWKEYVIRDSAGKELYRTDGVKPQDALAKAKTEREGLEAAIRKGVTRTTESSIPNFPMKENWTPMVFKRLLRQAADDGAQLFGWSPGIEQVKRYENALRQAVDEIKWDKGSQQSGHIKLEATKGDNSVFSAVVPVTGKGNVRGESASLDEIIGKEMARQIRDSKEPEGTIKGDELAIGGEGMQGFYDNILRKWANDYIKKWAVQVERRPIQTGEGEKKVWSFPITDQMRTDIQTKGQPLYQPRTDEDVATSTTPGFERGFNPGFGLGQSSELRDRMLKQIAPSGSLTPLSDMGIENEVEPTEGSFQGKAEPSITVHLPESNFTETAHVAAMLGHALLQDAVIPIEYTPKGKQFGLQIIPEDKLQEAMNDDQVNAFKKFASGKHDYTVWNDKSRIILLDPKMFEVANYSEKDFNKFVEQFKPFADEHGLTLEGFRQNSEYIHHGEYKKRIEDSIRETKRPDLQEALLDSLYRPSEEVFRTFFGSQGFTPTGRYPSAEAGLKK